MALTSSHLLPSALTAGDEQLNASASAATVRLAHAPNPKQIITATSAALSLISATGGVGVHRSAENAHIPVHLRRRVKTSRQLFEAAAMAARGEPTPGTLAALKLSQANQTGDFKLATEIVDWIKAQAPAIQREAERAAIAERENASVVDTSIKTQTSKLDRAAAKRERKAARRRQSK